jgi:PPK2 family polyphosphate:nucleotide phosphotransferase
MALEKARRSFADEFRVTPGKPAKLARHDPADSCGLSDSPATSKAIAENHRRISDLQHLLYADARFALLIVLQGIDASGKDGTTRHLLTGVNPQGVRVSSFKAPTSEELGHDYLWRIHKVCPAKGEIGLFNRSHYEDVLVVRVHELVAKKVWSGRYRQINQFERHLVENHTVILKFFLHISKEEQRRRLQERIDNPKKSWKMEPKDLDERKLWDDYMRSYEDAMTECSTGHAPWYIIPADRKWFRDLVISQIVADTLDGLDLHFPRPTFDPSKFRVV